MKKEGKVEEKLVSLTKKIKQDRNFVFISALQEEFPQSEIFLVGGVVRDQIIGRKLKDFDFVIRNIPPKKLKNFLSKKGWIGLVGRSFGVYKFMPRGSKLKEAIDIALPRTEISTGSGYRDFEIQSNPTLSIEEDLSRRDFTMNAMAVNMKDDSLVDPFGGLGDIEKKKIRTVRDPYERFSEDYSRILRAVRFSAELGFKIESKTWEVIRKLAPKILTEQIFENKKRTTVPYETVSSELLKTLDTDPLKMLELYDQSGILKLLLPEVEALKGVEQPQEFHEEGDVFEHTKICLKKISKDASIELKLALLLHDIGKPPTQKTPEEHGVDRIRFDEHAEIGAEMAGKICKRLRLSKKMTEHIVWLVKNHLLFISGRVEDMRPATVKKYFIDDYKKGDDLLELYRIDVESSQSINIKENLRRHEEVVKYVNKMRDSFKKAKVKTFRHVISGNDVIKYFDIKPGPLVGKYLAKADRYILEYVTKYNKEPKMKDVVNYLKKSI
jgi:poly(A) polymerase